MTNAVLPQALEFPCGDTWNEIKLPSSWAGWRLSTTLLGTHSPTLPWPVLPVGCSAQGLTLLPGCLVTRSCHNEMICLKAAYGWGEKREAQKFLGLPHFQMPSITKSKGLRPSDSLTYLHPWPSILLLEIPTAERIHFHLTSTIHGMR